MIKGSCLCGGVRFEIARVLPLFELCHCRRCRKATGSAFSAAVAVRPEDFRLVQGLELISRYEAPILDAPPRTAFVSAVAAVRTFRLRTLIAPGTGSR